MAQLTGIGGMKGKNLIASFTDNQITKNEKGVRTGAFVTVQVDQSTMTQKAAKEGKADTNPYLESHTVEGKRDGGTYVSHTVWYSDRQLQQMQDAGKSVDQKDGTHAIAFKGNVQKAKDSKTGESRMIVVTQKQIPANATPEQKAKLEKQNEQNALQASDFAAKFGPDSLAKQAKITSLAKQARDKAKAAEKSAEKMAEAEQAQAEAAATEPEVPFG